jgi:hypothetical protein
MTRSTHSQGGRTRKRRPALASNLEHLEHRTLMASGQHGVLAHAATYRPSVFPPRTVSHYSVPQRLALPVGARPRVLANLDNEGRTLSGKDRDGDEWVITVHGPGAIIVTDVTPNDGVLADELDTIRIINSDPHRTYVTGQVTASARVITDGTINFNRLIAENGVQSIILNGFNLTRTTVAPYAGQPNNVGPEIYLPGGVQKLQFNNIVAEIDLALNDQPFEVVIGSPTRPLKQRPEIKIGNVFNTVLDSGLTPIPNGLVQTNATVNFLVNGEIGKLEMASATKRPVLNPGQEFNEPAVSTTGRTAVRTLAAGQLKVSGAARNLVLSRAGRPFQPQNGLPGVPPTPTPTVPFQSPNSGLRYLRRAEFGGPTDAVGLDVAGPIGTLKFRRGIGDPTGAQAGQTNLGYNEARRGYPSFGLLGGQIRAASIRKLGVGPNNLILQTPQDPDFMQARRKGSTTYFARPGNALTSTAITTADSIGDVHIVGDSFNSQIAAGFDYKAYIAGLDPTRSPSQIRRFNQRGNLVDSVVSASYSPGPDGIYDDATGTNVPSADDIVGPGTIRGNLTGQRFLAGGTNALNYRGAGVFARTKLGGHLPPPNRTTRPHGVLVRP